jgi:hypothetical protein
MKTQKAARFRCRKQQLLASYEPIAPNSIDMLRDGTSFPESCGEVRDIGSVLETVKCRAQNRFVGSQERLGAIPVLGRGRLRVPFIEYAS